MTALPAGPETLATFTLEVEAGRLVADVLCFADGTTRLRLGSGDGTGHVLTFAHIAALRIMLAKVLEEMATAEGRAA